MYFNEANEEMRRSSNIFFSNQTLLAYVGTIQRKAVWHIVQITRKRRGEILRLRRIPKTKIRLPNQ